MGKGKASLARPMQVTGSLMLSIRPAWVAAIEMWERELRAAGRPDTTRYLRVYHVRRFANAHPDVAPFAITREQIVDWMAMHEWAPQTRRSYRASLRGFCRWAHASGNAKIDPTFTLPVVKVPRSLPRPAPNSVVDNALRHLDLRVRMLIMLLTFTGMRRGEVAKLHTRDLQEGLTGWGIRVIGKGGHERVIPVDQDIATMLRLVPTGYVFPGQIDGHLSAAYVGKLVSAALDGKWTAHTLRHRYASLAYSVTRDLRAVQELLGHASVTTTQIYTLVADSSLREAAAAARTGLTAA